MNAELDTPSRLRFALLAGWCAFWLLMIAVGVQDEWRHGVRPLWQTAAVRNHPGAGGQHCWRGGSGAWCAGSTRCWRGRRNGSPDC